MIPVILHTPHAAGLPNYGVEMADEYFRDAMRDCLLRGEAPFAWQGLYDVEGVLRPNVPEEAGLGLKAGAAWQGRSDYAVFYINLGINPEMQAALHLCQAEGRTVKMRSLHEWSVAVAITERILP